MEMLGCGRVMCVERGGYAATAGVDPGALLTYPTTAQHWNGWPARAPKYTFKPDLRIN